MCLEEAQRPTIKAAYWLELAREATTDMERAEGGVAGRRIGFDNTQKIKQRLFLC